MVEVFKTNVCDPEDADRILRIIHTNHPSYRANFDLEDCDCILRVVFPKDKIEYQSVIQLLIQNGFEVRPLKE